MARYRHYTNSKTPGVSVFITSTILDFVHAFKRPEMKDKMVDFIFAECRRTDTSLHAYVVMSHHLHLLLTLSENMNVSRYMQKFKERSSKDLIPLLTVEERKGFDLQRGLNRSTFWKSGFRSLPAQNHKIFIQKRNYIHMNPVRAGIVQLPWEYRWSSSSLLVGGAWTPDQGLPLVRNHEE
jgi:putative transposase